MITMSAHTEADSGTVAGAKKEDAPASPELDTLVVKPARRHAIADMIQGTKHVYMVRSVASPWHREGDGAWRVLTVGPKEGEPDSLPDGFHPRKWVVGTHVNLRHEDGRWLGEYEITATLKAGKMDGQLPPKASQALWCSGAVPTAVIAEKPGEKPDSKAKAPAKSQAKPQPPKSGSPSDGSKSSADGGRQLTVLKGVSNALERGPGGTIKVPGGRPAADGKSASDGSQPPAKSQQDGSSSA